MPARSRGTSSLAAQPVRSVLVDGRAKQVIVLGGPVAFRRDAESAAARLGVIEQLASADAQTASDHDGEGGAGGDDGAQHRTVHSPPFEARVPASAGVRCCHDGTVFGIVLCLAGVAALVAAFVGAYRHREWNWRYGPARWLGPLGVCCCWAT